MFAVLSKCGFHLYQCQSNLSLFNNLFFFGGMMANFDINVLIIVKSARLKIIYFHHATYTKTKLLEPIGKS